MYSFLCIRKKGSDKFYDNVTEEIKNNINSNKAKDKELFYLENLIKRNKFISRMILSILPALSILLKLFISSLEIVAKDLNIENSIVLNITDKINSMILKLVLTFIIMIFFILCIIIVWMFALFLGFITTKIICKLIKVSFFNHQSFIACSRMIFWALLISIFLACLYYKLVFISLIYLFGFILMKLGISTNMHSKVYNILKSYNYD